MKYLLLFILPFTLIASQEALQDLQEKIDTLQQRVQQIEAKDALADEALVENSDILEQVEMKSILDKINLSPELLLRLDKFHYTNKGITGEDTPVVKDGVATNEQRRDEFTKNYALASLVRFRLNLTMQLENIKFYGRLVNMGSSQSNERLCILSHDIKTGTNGSAFDVDRAYVDYSMSPLFGDKFTFTFGILPTTNGTPFQYSQNKKRSALFPALVFDMNTYGFIGTQQFANDLYLRFVLARAYSLRANFYPYQCNRENIDNANIIGLYADKQFTLLQTQALLSFGMNILNNLKAHPYLGPDVDSSHSKDLGTMVTFGAGIDIPNIAQSSTTLFVHTALCNPHPNGEKEDYRIVDLNTSTTANGDAGFTTADYASGTMLKKNGYSFYIGSKYQLTPTLNIGAEYNYGSKYWYAATQGAEDIYNKLAIRGNATELYSLWQFHKYINIKLSYLHIKEDYTGSGWHFGEPAKKDAVQDIGSVSFEARF
jgi:hypothetical protein